MRRTPVSPLTVTVVIIAAAALTTGTALAHEGHEGTPEAGFNYLWLIASAIAGLAVGFAAWRFARRGRNQGR